MEIVLCPIGPLQSEFCSYKLNIAGFNHGECKTNITVAIICQWVNRFIMKAVVVGASGLLGSAFARAAHRRGFELIGVSNKTELESKYFKETLNFDLSNPELLTEFLLDYWPDVIINTAAISEPDVVDADPRYAAKLNIDLPRKLAQIASHLSACYFHPSSDMVFDGTERNYRPTAVPNPLTLYGEQKLNAEIEVLKYAAEHSVVLRLPLLNGNSLTGKRSMHEKVLWALSENKKLDLFMDELRQPCSVDNVAEVIVELSERQDLRGLFHWGGKQLVSRYEIGKKIADRFCLSDELIAPTLSKDVLGLKARPKKLELILSPLQGKLKTKPQMFDDQLADLKIPDALYSWFRENTRDPSCYVRRF